MGSLDLPKLRPLRRHATIHQGLAYVRFEDALGLASPSLLVPVELDRVVLRRFDGRTTLGEVQAAVLRETGRLVTMANLQELIGALDEALVLEGPNFEAFAVSYRRERTRPAALAGVSYAGTERALRAELGRYFADPAGAGMPDGAAGPPLRGILCPHIDFARGGPTYTWAYRALAERCDAAIFVVLGVAHQPCRHRFALTGKDFQTPLGLARTDRTFVDRVAALAGSHLFDDELVHRTEHSIEFQVVFLQYLLGGRRDFAIVPILVGSFHDLMERSVDPIQDPEVRRLIDALRAAESVAERPVAYIGGIDLAHVGRQFGDPGRLDVATLDRVRRFDAAMLGHATAVDPTGWFAEAAAVSDRWRVCGLAATYTLLHAMGPARGRLLKYDQAVNPERTCGVSFASVAFDAVT